MVKKVGLLMSTPTSSSTSRMAHSCGDSPYSRWPPGMDHVPCPWEFWRFMRRTLSPSLTMTPTPTYGRFGMDVCSISYRFSDGGSVVDHRQSRQGSQRLASAHFANRLL